ncbi:MAG TPA: organic hydroperoxide resistance protein [Candidatus Limiplasma sp.]|nr:organic hydroperoxide resistance protein [Candidatus Limiplasma sp.]HPS82319.1 organic hydroperoxide resistance protein [Candidatus Limiplasma sp.]
MKILYRAKAVSKGGRDGQVTVENSPIQFEMALPAELAGTKAVGFNPEQLFAAGYSACFGSALQHVYKVKRLKMEPPEVHANVGIGRNDAGGFALAVDLEGVFTGVDQATADALMAEAHLVCPYSNATRGNIEVTLTAKVK